MSIHVVASDAKQSIVSHKERMDCFASLAMTVSHSVGKAPRAHHRGLGKRRICRVGKGALAPCPPFRPVDRWWARCALPTLQIN